MGQAISSVIEVACNFVKEKVLRIMPPVGKYVVRHPWRTVLHLCSVVVLALPGAVAPLLALTGFTGGGIAGGSIAAGIQSSLGNVAAGGLFATLQSAAMGGYGTAAVAGVVGKTAAAIEGVNLATGIKDGITRFKRD